MTGEVDARVHRGAGSNGSERTPKPLVKATLVLTGLSDGMAITPSCSWSSFFQLSNRFLKVELPALSNGPPMPCVVPTRAGLIPSRFSSAVVTW